MAAAWSTVRALRRSWIAWTAILAVGAAACGGPQVSAPVRDRRTLRADAERASALIADSLVGHLHSAVKVEGGSYQPCQPGKQQNFYSSSLTVIAPTGTSVEQYQSQIIPELRQLGWTVTVVDVAKLHTFGGPVRHPIDRIREGGLFGAVNILKIAKRTETIVFVNTACSTTVADSG
jgi:hypothetical protein